MAVFGTARVVTPLSKIEKFNFDIVDQYSPDGIRAIEEVQEEE